MSSQNSIFWVPAENICEKLSGLNATDANVSRDIVDAIAAKRGIHPMKLQDKIWMPLCQMFDRLGEVEVRDKVLSARIRNDWARAAIEQVLAANPPRMLEEEHDQLVQDIGTAYATQVAAYREEMRKREEAERLRREAKEKETRDFIFSL
jgi:hypothetical protein